MNNKSDLKMKNGIIKVYKVNKTVISPLTHT